MERDERHWSDVVKDLENGRLESLKTHLVENPGKLDLWVGRQLVRMLSGQSSFVLSAVRDPKLAPNEPTRSQKFAIADEVRKIAMFVGAHGGLARGHRDRAIYAASQEFGRKPRWIKNKLRNQARWMELGLRKKKHLPKLRDAFGPSNVSQSSFEAVEEST